MAQAYTAPTWTDGSGEGISASNLQAISNALQGIVQGTDKAIHDIAINGSTITFTFVDGTVETAQAVNLKGIVSIDKTGTSGLVDTYTITYTDGTTSTFTVTNGTNSDKADLTLIAPVQTTLTASRAYAVGEQFVYNQVLYKVTQAIASGAAITIGTNAVVAGSITSQLLEKDVITITPEEGFTFSNVEAYKWGNITKVSASVSFSTPVSSGTVKLGAIDKHKPIKSVISFAISGTNIGANFINTAGDIYFRYMNGTQPFNDCSMIIIY